MFYLLQGDSTLGASNPKPDLQEDARGTGRDYQHSRKATAGSIEFLKETRLRDTVETQLPRRVHVGIWHILRAQRVPIHLL